MEKISEVIDSIKITNYIVNNVMKLIKHKKTHNMKLVIRNNLIHIDIDNCIYTIANMMMYKRFIDKISYKYKIILKYIPRNISDNYYEKMLLKYNQNNKLKIVINENNIDII